MQESQEVRLSDERYKSSQGWKAFPSVRVSAKVRLLCPPSDTFVFLAHTEMAQHRLGK